MSLKTQPTTIDKTSTSYNLRLRADERIALLTILEDYIAQISPKSAMAKHIKRRLEGEAARRGPVARVTNYQLEEMLRLRRGGKSLSWLAGKYGISAVHVGRLCAERGAKPVQPLPRGGGARHVDGND